MQVVGVRFKTGGKAYNFFTEESYTLGQKVKVETERGLQLGEIVSTNLPIQTKNMKEIMGLATQEEYEKYLNNVKEADKALKDTKKLVKKMNLNMSLIDASFSLDKKMLLFNFVSDERVDFRDLVKELAGKYHTRIELHQIGVRDKAKEIGGIGPCGRVLCCHGCLKSVNAVNISMVKNQGIALNPTKINGPCGRLLCCFTYENDLYEENRKLLPSIGEKITYEGKEAVVTDVDVLNKNYTIKTSENNFEKVAIK